MERFTFFFTPKAITTINKRLFPPSMKHPYFPKGMLSYTARAIRQQRPWHPWELNDPSLFCPSSPWLGNSPLFLFFAHITSLLNLTPSCRQKFNKSLNFRSPSGVTHQKYTPWYASTASQRTRRTDGLLSDPLTSLSLLFLLSLPSDRVPYLLTSTRLSYCPPIL